MPAPRSGWKTTTLLITLYVVLYVVFIGEDWLQRTIRTEHEYNRTFYTAPVSAAAETRARSWFDTLFVQTGIVQTTFEATVPTAADNRRALGAQGFAGSLFQWWEGRLRAWWTVIFQSLERLSATLLWWPYALFLFVPWIVDGAIQRKIRLSSFQFSSPLQHVLSMQALRLLAIATLVLFFLPVPLHPLIWPAFILTGGIAAGVAVANFMKRA